MFPSLRGDHISAAGSSSGLIGNDFDKPAACNDRGMSLALKCSWIARLYWLAETAPERILLAQSATMLSAERMYRTSSSTLNTAKSHAISVMTGWQSRLGVCNFASIPATAWLSWCITRTCADTKGSTLRRQNSAPCASRKLIQILWRSCVGSSDGSVTRNLARTSSEHDSAV